MPNNAVGLWSAFGGAILAAFGGIIGIVSRQNKHEARLDSIEARQDREAYDAQEWRSRVEGKIDTLIDHFVERGIHGGGQ